MVAQLGGKREVTLPSLILLLLPGAVAYIFVCAVLCVHCLLVWLCRDVFFFVSRISHICRFLNLS